MNIRIEQLIEIVLHEVIAELQRRGIEIDGGTTAPDALAAGASRRAVIDLSMFKTPVLTEHQCESLEASISEIVIPRGTIITPGAKDIIKKRSLVVSSDVSTR